MHSETKSKGPFDAHQKSLKALKRRNRLRNLSPSSGIDFASNDYLGLANDPTFKTATTEALARGIPVGATGSRLLRGNHEEHQKLEHEAAQFFGAQTALFLAGGFTANHAIFSTLPQRGDLIVFDELIHASVHDGMRASRAECVAAAHNNAQGFDDAITQWRTRGGTGTAWIAIETLYSMDGDRAPLDDLAAVADRHDAVLVLDEAHATGVFGPNGRGLSAHLEGRHNVISLHTCGKALGVMGALVCAPCTIKDFLINRSRSLIYATAPSPLIAALVRHSLKLIATGDARRTDLKKLTTHTINELQKLGSIKPSNSQIQPIIVGSDERALALSHAIQSHGFDVRAIRPPTVPEGTARLRLAITLNVSETDITDMMDALSYELERLA